MRNSPQEFYNPEIKALLEVIQNNEQLPSILGEKMLALLVQTLTNQSHHSPDALAKDLKRVQEMLEQTNRVARVGGWEANLETGDLYWTNVIKELHEVSEDFEPDIQTAIEFYKEGKSREKMTNALERAIETGEAYELEVQLVTAKNNTKWVKSIGNAEFVDGKCKRLFGALQDIDERKRKEMDRFHSREKIELDLITEKSMLSAFVENTPAAVAMFNTEFQYIAYSKRWVEEYKLESRNLIGLSHYEVFPNISDEWKAIHLRCLQGAVERNEEDRWRPDGWPHDQFLRWEVRPWYRYDGTTGGIMMLTQDITEMCLQREELTKAKEQAEQASKAKSEFLANMSHEIRTPLNGVIGFTDLILKTNLSETQQQYLTIVNQSANTLLNIISDILDFSKIEAGKLDLDMERCDLHELVLQTADVITYQVQKKELKMKLTLAPTLPRHVWADPVRLKQILINLLGNAAKFTEQGEIELKIEASAAEEAGFQNFRFEIRDTGIGIKKEKQHKIFDVFLQEDASTTKKYGGTGLGLSISNKLLSLMGSQLQLTSTPGEGSTFYFDILLKTDQEEKSHSPNQEPIPTPVNTPENNQENIAVLIAEDNAVNMLLLKTIIRRIAPYASIEEATNGEECFQRCTENIPDIIFMDILMPEINGYEATRMIRATYPDTSIPIIALTASNAIGEKERCLAAGMDDYLTKPVVMDSIAYVIDTWVRKMKVRLNIDIVKDIVGDNEARLNEFFVIAKREISNTFARLQEFYVQEDISGIQQAAHKLCGTSVSAGLVQLSRIARKLEHLPAFNEGVIAPLLRSMKDEIEAGFELMDKIISKA